MHSNLHFLRQFKQHSLGDNVFLNMQFSIFLLVKKKQYLSITHQFFCLKLHHCNVAYFYQAIQPIRQKQICRSLKETNLYFELLFIQQSLTNSCYFKFPLYHCYYRCIVHASHDCLQVNHCIMKFRTLTETKKTVGRVTVASQ